MNILIVSLNYFPELTGIGKYSGEMATWLARQGHNVRVITAPPYYPGWKVLSAYNPAVYRREIIDGVKVYRCPLWIPAKPSGLKRLLHLFTFAVSSFPIILFQIFWRPSVVWVVAPAFFSAPSAWLLARLCGAVSWLHIQDYEIDAAFDLGFLKGRYLRHIITACERFVFSLFDRVSSISNRMNDRAISKGVSPNRVVLFPNWVDVSSIRPDVLDFNYRLELGIPSDAVVVLYSGNMGNKQGLDILGDAVHFLKNNKSIYFIFCGEGVARGQLQEACSGFSNVFFLDLQPIEKLGSLLTTADIHLLPQRGDAADLVMPSKLTGMLASGRPVVATAHLGTEIERVVNRCGLVVAPEQPEKFANAILTLANDRCLRKKFGDEARLYAETNLNIDYILRNFEIELSKLVSAI